MSSQKTAGQEDEYFARQEYERQKKAHDADQQKLEEDERESLKKLHYMRCPKCGMNLVTIDYKGVQIDKCTGCEGVWLDAGELEDISKMEHPVMNKLFDVFRPKDD